MLFWIAIFMLVIGLIVTYVDVEIHTMPMFISCISFMCMLVGFAATLTFTIMGSIAKFDTEHYITEEQTRYESLMYRYEHETDLVKRAETITEIVEWNDGVTWGRKNQNNFWYGFLIPDIYDDLEYIELKEE